MDLRSAESEPSSAWDLRSGLEVLVTVLPRGRLTVDALRDVLPTELMMVCWLRLRSLAGSCSRKSSEACSNVGVWLRIDEGIEV